MFVFIDEFFCEDLLLMGMFEVVLVFILLNLCVDLFVWFCEVDVKGVLCILIDGYWWLLFEVLEDGSGCIWFEFVLFVYCVVVGFCLCV